MNFPRIRLLPLVIFFAALMLTVRVHSVFVDFGRLPVTRTEAAGGKLSPADLIELDAIVIGQNKAQAQADLSMDAASGAEIGMMGFDPTQPDGIPLARPAEERDYTDPVVFTKNELEVLQNLSERREELDAREREIEQRMAVLEASENQINRKILRLKELETTINDLLIKYGDQERRKLERLARVYTAMKPKDAARIFNTLDMTNLLNVIEIMKERTSAAILAKMDVEKAKEVTSELAERRKLPVAGVTDRRF